MVCDLPGQTENIHYFHRVLPRATLVARRRWTAISGQQSSCGLAMALDRSCEIVEYLVVDFLGKACYKMAGVAVVL